MWGLIAANMAGRAVRSIGENVLSRGVSKITDKLFGKPKRPNALVELRDDALAAGFNPLTALQAGATGISGSSPVLASSNALLGVANEQNNWFNAPQRQMDRETTRLQQELLKAEIANVQAETRRPYQSFGMAPSQRGTNAPPGVMSESPEMATYRLDPDDQGAYPPEELAMKNATDGTLDEWVTEVWNRNADFNMPGLGPQNWRTDADVLGFEIRPGSLAHKVQSWLRPSQPLMAADPRMDVWRAQNYGPNYNPPGWRR